MKREIKVDGSIVIKKKLKLEEIQDIEMCSKSEVKLSESEKYTEWDYSKINFPDFSKCSIITLPEIDAKYLPGSTNMQSREYCFKNGLNTSKNTKETPGHKILVNSAKNWRELKRMKNIDILEKLKESGCQVLWNGEDQPLVNPSKANSLGNIFHFFQ